jgi:DNA (cytosine-5)-methyltransferase 1
MLEQRLTEVNDRHKTHYNVERRVVNAADYGVAQRRSRAILVALRDGGPFIWPTATHTENPVRAWDALIGVDVLGTAPMAVGKWAALLPSIPEGQNYLWHTEQGGGRPLFGYRTRFWSFLLKLAKDQPSWTVSAQPGPATGPFHWDNRPLAIPEMLRLQSFPSDWIVEGDLHDQIRQVGNATPPLLAEEIGRALARQLCNRAFGQVNLVHEIHRARTVPGPGPVAEVPRTYEQLEGKHLAHPGTGKGPRPRAAVGTTRHRPSTT